MSEGIHQYTEQQDAYQSFAGSLRMCEAKASRAECKATKKEASEEKSKGNDNGKKKGQASKS